MLGSSTRRGRFVQKKNNLPIFFPVDQFEVNLATSLFRKEIYLGGSDEDPLTELDYIRSLSRSREFIFTRVTSKSPSNIIDNTRL